MPDIHKASALSPALPVGTTLGNYIIRKVIGSGGFGITYLAQEEITDKLIVIKENYPAEISFRDMTSLMVGPSGESRKEAYDWALKRFLDEAKILSRLSHPNIVPILAAFKALGTAYYVMPHVEGTELHKVAPAPDTITAEWLLPVLEKLLSALDYLHSQGLIHRDIKPNNILLREDGEPILIDFGTARALESTHSHSHIGTPGYMPLEQHSTGGKRGPWTDFYALGATCYHLITGELPPSSTERADEGEYLPLAGRASLAERFPEHVLSSIDKALNMKRLARWQSAQEWLEALKGKTSSPKSTQLTTKPHTSSSKKKRYTLSLIFLLLLAALSYGGFYYNHQQPVNQPHAGINPEQYNSELYAAARDGDVEKVRRLLAAGADVNWANEAESQFTPLILVAQNGHTECVRLLLAAPGININQANQSGNTPLICAACNGHTECVRLLLAAPGIDVNQANQYGNTSLNLAACNGHTECVRLLLAAPGIDVNQAGQYGNTPLICAAGNGHTECVRLLLAAPGININQAGQDGTTPLICAASMGHKECVRLLLAAPGININQATRKGSTPLICAADQGHTECVRLLLAAPGIDVNKENQHGDTPLWLAVINDHAECIELIRNAVGKVPEHYNSSLFTAAAEGNADKVRLLLAAAADVNWANEAENQNTPLIVAAENGHAECVRLLLAATGIDVNKANKNDETPLHWAENNNHSECADLIRAAGGKSRRAAILLEQMGISSEQYNSSLYAAARDGDAEKVKLLIAAEADVNWKNDADNGNTPLIWAAKNGHTECVRLLLAAQGIDVNKANQDGDTPLICAAFNGHTECVRLLLAAPGININQANLHGNTPLSFAAENGHTECVRLLLAAPGIDVNMADEERSTPLSWAAYNGHTDCVRLLLAAPGIDVNMANNYGRTPLSAAEQFGHPECARLIRAAGGRR